MAERDRGYTAFCLRSFAGIIDNERVHDRQVFDQCFGPAGIRQRHRFAGKPFQRSMRPDMDQGIRAKLAPQIKVECHIGVTGCAAEIVVVIIARVRLSAFGLKGDQHIAHPKRGQMECAVFEI